jgi:galactokinase
MQANTKEDFYNLVTSVEASFESKFKRQARWIAAAPGRVNLIGEHTDYNGGFVFPMAIERSTVLAADEREEATGGNVEITIYSENLGDTQTLKILDNTIEKTGDWADYIAGIFVGFLNLGIQFKSIDIALGSNVPIGGGLSSSAALEVSVATLLEAVTGKTLSPIEKVLLCQKAEHEFPGVPCGIMDQFTSVNGKKNHLLLLDCNSQQAEAVPFTSDEYSILIINSNVKHSLTSGEYSKRRAECEIAAEILNVDTLRQASVVQLEESARKMDPIIFRRARHVIGEIERTQQAALAMKAGDWATVGELMLASHNSLRDDYEVSCKELDLLVELMMELGGSKGVVGTRMTGGGFGGCTVSVVPTRKADDLIAGVSQRYIEKIGIEPDIFTTRPAKGAQMIKL